MHGQLRQQRFVWSKLFLLIGVFLLLSAGCVPDTGTTHSSNTELPAPQSGMADADSADGPADETAVPCSSITKDGAYTTKDDVALYLYTYGTLPDNFITKKEAQSLGWSGGSLEPYAPGKCIGGDYFGNYEGLLPEQNGRDYHECDIDTLGQNSRGAKRIVYSNDGLVYYTGDHYASFELLYGNEAN